MIYSIAIQINGKEHNLSYGIRKQIEYNRRIKEFEKYDTFEGSLRISHFLIDLKLSDSRELKENEKDRLLNFDEFLEFIDNSDVTFEELSNSATEALTLGTYKGKKSKEEIDKIIQQRQMEIQQKKK